MRKGQRQIDGVALIRCASQAGASVKDGTPHKRRAASLTDAAACDRRAAHLPPAGGAGRGLGGRMSAPGAAATQGADKTKGARPPLQPKDGTAKGRGHQKGWSAESACGARRNHHRGKRHQPRRRQRRRGGRGIERPTGAEQSGAAKGGEQTTEPLKGEPRARRRKDAAIRKQELFRGAAANKRHP